MTLRDQIAADLDVFLNVDEFAAVAGIRHHVNDVQVVCILDAQSLAEGHPTEGVYTSEAVLHVKKADLDHVPVVEERMIIDARPATVIHVDEVMGMLSIRLHWYES